MPLNCQELKLPEKYVSGAQLLELLFDEQSRPSLRWLRSITSAKKIQSVKIGRLVFYDPAAIKIALEKTRVEMIGGAR